MRNTIIVTVILFVAVIAASIYYFSDLNKEKQENIGAFKHLPSSTLLITSIRNDEVTDNIFKDFELFEAMLGFKETETLRRFKNHILRSELVKEYVQDVEMLTSFHPEKKGIQTLFTIPINSKISDTHWESITKSLAKHYRIRSLDTLSHTITSYSFGTPDTTLYTVYYQNTIFASASKSLIASIVNKNTARLSASQTDFFVKKDSRNTPFSVYFPNQQLDSIAALFQQRAQGAFLNQFKGIKGQSAWHINFKHDALMLTGESELENTAENYIAIFRNQRKTSQHLYNFFPANTAVYLEYSISDRAQFNEDLQKLFEQRKETKRIQDVLKSNPDSVSTRSNIEKSWGNSFALIELSNQTNMGFILLNDTTIWKQTAGRLLEDSSDSVYRFKDNNLLYAFYGDAFKVFQRPYVTRIGQLLIFANTRSSLDSYRKDWKQKNLLIGTLGFKNFEKLQGNEANVTFFIHTKNANTKISYSLPETFRKNFNDKDNFGFQDFYSWSAQLSGNRGNFLSQIYAVYKSKSTLGAIPDWSYPLQNKAITRPHVFQYSDTSQFILLQELDHTLHAISPQGQKLWSAVFSGRVVGEMVQLEDRSIVLVTDKNRLYRFDTSGKSFPGFSVNIPDEPIASPTIVELNNQKAILVSSKKQIHAFTLAGKPVDPWKKIDFDGEILGSVKSVGEYLVFGTTYGRIFMINQNGEKHKEIDIPGDITFTNPIGILDKGNADYSTLAIGNSGKFYKLPFQGNIQTYPIPSLGAKYYADFVNLNNSSAPELVVLEGGFLRVFDITDSLQQVSEYSFTKSIDTRPQYFNAYNASSSLIGIAARSSNLLYVFGENGNVLEGFPVEGQPLFYYGKINYNSAVYLLCMRRDHKLHAFRHQK